MEHLLWHEFVDLIDEHVVDPTDDGIKVAGYEVARDVLQGFKGGFQPRGERLQVLETG